MTTDWNVDLDNSQVCSMWLYELAREARMARQVARAMGYDTNK